jgi:hypothetical protein
VSGHNVLKLLTASVIVSFVTIVATFVATTIAAIAAIVPAATGISIAASTTRHY